MKSTLFTYILASVLVQLPAQFKSQVLINSASPPSSGLEDDLQFLFKWPGSLFNFEDDLKQKLDILDMTTNKNEKYKCTVPILHSEDDDDDKDPLANRKV